MRYTIPLLALFLMGASDLGEQCKVLIVGDSLVGTGSGLEMELRKRFEKAGATVKTEWRMGGRVSTIQKEDAIHKIMYCWKPDIIIVSLGMNSSRTHPRTFEKDVRNFGIVQYRKQPCFWIGPPILVEGTGYAVARMRNAVKKHTQCKYFDTAGEVTFPPKSVTGFHVKRWKGRKWAAKVWNWMRNKGGS